MFGRAVLFVALAGCNPLLDLNDTRLVDGPIVDKVPVTQKKVFLANDQAGPAGSATFMAAGAAAAGDSVVLLVGCQSYPTVQTDVQVTAPGWSFTRLGTIEKAQGQYWATAVGAIAPDTQPVAVTVTWSASCGEILALGDEFGATDPRGGPMTFDARVVNPGETGDCTATLTTAHRNEAIWAACYSGDHVVSVNAPYTMTGNTTGGEMSGYLITTDPPGTVETATFTNAPNAPFVMTAVSLIPGL